MVCESSGMSLSVSFTTRLNVLMKQAQFSEPVQTAGRTSMLYCPRCGEHLEQTNSTGTQLRCALCALKLEPTDVFEMVDLHPHSS